MGLRCVPTSEFVPYCTELVADSIKVPHPRLEQIAQQLPTECRAATRRPLQYRGSLRRAGRI